VVHGWRSHEEGRGLFSVPGSALAINVQRDKQRNEQDNTDYNELDDPKAEAALALRDLVSNPDER